MSGGCRIYSLGFSRWPCSVTRQSCPSRWKELGRLSSWPRDKKLTRWKGIDSLHLHTGNNHFVVRAKGGRKITNAGFNADQGQFIHDIRERTHLPLQVTKPGTWKSETYEVPYEENEVEQEDGVHA